MRKTVFAFFVFSVFGFFGCSLFSDGDSSGEDSNDRDYSIVKATESKSFSYDSDFPIFEVAPTTRSVSISGVPSGKSVYLAKVNSGSETVSFDDTRFAKSGSGLGRAVFGLSDFSLGDVEIKKPKFGHFAGKKISPEDLRNSLRAVGVSPVSAKSISRTAGTQKELYVDTDPDLDSYRLRGATLRAVGTYCNVWVVDDYYTSGEASGAKVDSSIAKEIQEKFDSFYPVVRNVFGNESDRLINSYSATDALISMSSYSDTGTSVNIVLYDIGNDYNLPDEKKCGVLGYFYSKDYFLRTSATSSDVDYSNEGKYFYVDSEYAVSEFETTISTLAHEFQHMVNFGVKDIEKGVSPDAAYNEMLSMLCEDMMAEFLGLDDSNSVKMERIPCFNTSYFLSGIREYRNDDLAGFSYSTSYGFGSWLCRQYGGAKLVKAIMSNSLVGNDSLVAAVNSVNGKNYTFDDLFKQFLIACTNGGAASGFTHNQDAKQTVTYGSGSGGYKYPMTALNLWNSAYGYPTDDNGFLVGNQAAAAYESGVGYTGPFVFSNRYGFDLRPEYGITLHKLGETGGSSLSLEFSEEGAGCVTMYVIVQ